jgi:hypothetical protein
LPAPAAPDNPAPAAGGAAQEAEAKAQEEAYQIGPIAFSIATKFLPGPLAQASNVIS